MTPTPIRYASPAEMEAVIRALCDALDTWADSKDDQGLRDLIARARRIVDRG